MKRFSIPALIATVALLITATSCVKNEYYNTQPVQPIGYQFIFDDNFNNNIHNWAFSDHNNAAYVDIVNGMLEYDYNPLESGTNTVAIATGANLVNDFLIQTKIKSDNAMGLVFGVSNYDYGYSFFIDGQGSFAVYKEGTANVPVKTIMDWTYSDAINPGWNDVEIEQVGNYWIGYINGTKVFEIQAQYLAGSKIGFIVFAGTLGYADYLTVQW